VAPLRYHYLWLLFCSLPLKLIHLSPRHVVYSGVVWCGIGLMCVIALGLKFLLQVQTRIEQKTLLGIALLCVTGLDILPIVGYGIARHLWLSDMEWWNEPQITSWIGSLLWVPHHVGALLACFIGFLLLRHHADSHRRWAIAPVIVAGLAFASAVGMSVYVTFTFVVAVILWLLVLVVRKDRLEGAMFAAAGAIALLWALPYLSGLRGPGNGNALVEVALRTFPMGVFFAQQIGINFHTQFEVDLVNAIFLPINYALELGFFLAVAVLRLLRDKRGRIEATANSNSANESAAWTLVIASFLVGTCLRSSTLNSNDLGWRCFLPAQLILLLWGATLVYEIFHDWRLRPSSVAPQPELRPMVRAALVTLLLLGALGTAYQVFMLRMFPVLADSGAIAGPSWMAPNRPFGKRAYALRSVYELLDAQLPKSAVLQSNPATADPILHMLYSGHDAAAGDGECGTDFGGDPDVCAQRLQKLAPLFDLPDGSGLDAVCQEYGIDAVIVEDSDRAWHEPSSWVWNRRPAVANDYVRTFRCGKLSP